MPAEPSTTAERIVSLDVQRGVAIWMVIILHAFNAVYNYDWAAREPAKIMQLPAYVLAIGGLVAFFGGWKAYFLLISTIVSALGFTRKVAAGKDARAVAYKQLISGVCVVLIGYVVDGMLGGYLRKVIQTGSWADFSAFPNAFLSIGTLQLIGWATLIAAPVSYLLMRNGGVHKVRRNLLIYAGLTLAVLVLSPLVQHWVDNMHWLIPPPPDGKLKLYDYAHWPSSYVQRYNASLRAALCTLLAGDLEPLFPYLSTAFAGSAIGIALAMLRKDRRLPTVGLLISAAWFVVGIFFVTVMHEGFNMGDSRPLMGKYLLMVGGQLFTVFLVLRLVEFGGRERRFGQGWFTRQMRLWGMASLSLFVLDGYLSLAARGIMAGAMRLAGGTPADRWLSGAFGYGQEQWAILASLGVMLFDGVLVALWSRSNFKYGLEWWVVAINARLTGERSQRLDVGKLIGRPVHGQTAEAPKGA